MFLGYVQLGYIKIYFTYLRNMAEIWISHLEPYIITPINHPVWKKNCKFFASAQVTWQPLVLAQFLGEAGNHRYGRRAKHVRTHPRFGMYILDIWLYMWDTHIYIYTFIQCVYVIIYMYNMYIYIHVLIYILYIWYMNMYGICMVYVHTASEIFITSEHCRRTSRDVVGPGGAMARRRTWPCGRGSVISWEIRRRFHGMNRWYDTLWLFNIAMENPL